MTAPTPIITQRFPGRSVLVTGAGTGFGAAIAFRAAQEGARVGVHYRSSKAGAEDTVARIRAIGGEAVLMQGDITSWDDIKRMADTTFAAFGGLDVLMNNVGVGVPERRNTLQPSTASLALPSRMLTLLRRPFGSMCSLPASSKPRRP